MASNAGPVVRAAGLPDVAAMCRFGEQHVAAHYAPLIGFEAAQQQVRRWWDEAHIGAAVAEGLVVVADGGAQRLMGVGQRGRWGTDHVVYKLYVEPASRGLGLGPRLLDALIRRLPSDADRILVEHFAANERAGAFYEREGFLVERVEQSPTADPALAVVWRSRRLDGPSLPSIPR